MKIPFTGGCMCGAIRYECAAEPIAMGLCHCRDCQYATGSAFAAALISLCSAVTITGSLKLPTAEAGGFLTKTTKGLSKGKTSTLYRLH
jgi:hypothetical protein